MNSTQYFQMWDTSVREIRQLASGATILGPSLFYDPAQNPGEWQTYFAHIKAAGTLPDEISDHLESDGYDPVAVVRSIKSGIPSLPLSANEWLPQDQQTAGQSAWHLARFAQSGYANAMRGNWACCLILDLGGVIVSKVGGPAAGQHVRPAGRSRPDRPSAWPRRSRRDRRSRTAERGSGAARVASDGT